MRMARYSTPNCGATAVPDPLLPFRTFAILALTDLTAGHSSRGPRRQQKAKKQSCASVVGKRQRDCLCPFNMP